MGHANRKTLVRQVQERQDSLIRYGQSKKEAKKVNLPDGRKLSDTGIYSYNTYSTYLKHNCYFVKWCQANFRCRTLEDCRPHVDEWLQSRIDAGLSPYTIKLESAALAKLYDCRATDFIVTPARHRADITRSREATVGDKHFSETKNSELVQFCRATGLRRSELESLRGTQLIHDENGQWCLHIKGKGGRIRNAPIVGSSETVRAVVGRCEAAGEGLVWGKVHSNADIHHYRADYAKTIYRAHARPLDQLSPRQIYSCRGDQAGKRFDREAMRAASNALGHNRISVVAGNYLY